MQRATAPSNGFNDAIAWRPFDEGLKLSEETHKPLMLLVHASWCARCKELKPKFSEDEIAELSQEFVMVNVDQDREPRSQTFGPDGTYIPRVLFIDPDSGKPDTDLQNEGRSRYHYYYGPSDDLAGVMKKALARHGKS